MRRDSKLIDAAVLAAKTNRWTGHYANPSPATQVIELIEKIPQALGNGSIPQGKSPMGDTKKIRLTETVTGSG